MTNPANTIERHRTTVVMGLISVGIAAAFLREQLLPVEVVILFTILTIVGVYSVERVSRLE